MDATMSMRELAAAAGLSPRALRSWVGRGIVARADGRGRAARYDERHLVQARAAVRLRSQGMTLQDVRWRLRAATEAELERLGAPLPPKPVPAPAAAPALVPPSEPPAPSYPALACEVVRLMDGLTLLVEPHKGPLVRHIADAIYRHYGLRSG
jgi:DNA-binding transcriptional MerR regulator